MNDLLRYLCAAAVVVALTLVPSSCSPSAFLDPGAEAPGMAETSPLLDGDVADALPSASHADAAGPDAR